VKTRILVGIDSVDSLFGGCTTHFALFLIKAFTMRGATLVSPPYLVRLNPAVPLKTRGNASVALIFDFEREVNLDDLHELLDSFAFDYSCSVIHGSCERKYGIIVAKHSFQNPDRLVRFYEKAVTDVVPLELVKKALNSFKNLRFSGGRGLIGAIAALGFAVKESKKITFELIGNRDLSMIGRDRSVDADSILQLCNNYRKILFNNCRGKQVVAVPRGPDPVLVGLRSVEPCVFFNAVKRVMFKEPVFSWMLYITNQHTDPHLVKKDISNLKPYQTAFIDKAVVTRNPVILKGGHVMLEVSDERGHITALAFKKSGPVRNLLASLDKGDIISLLGVVKPQNGGKVMMVHKAKVISRPRE